MTTYCQSESRRGEGYLEQSVSRPMRGKGLPNAKVRAAKDVGCGSVVVCYGPKWLLDLI